MKEELQRMLDILISFLGEPKSNYIDIESSLSFEFNCPRCAEENGFIEDNKYNLSINLSRGGGLFNCWKCSTHHDEMKGKIYKLFKLYGNENLWNEYKECVKRIRESDLYLLHFDKEDFNVESEEEIQELMLPTNFRKFKREDKTNYKFVKYLQDRGIGWDIIENYNMGYTDYNPNNKIVSNRIIIPSYNDFDEINYWTGRSIYPSSSYKYFNTNVERKKIIFNENKICWDNNIILCEGPFDSIVLPNSIPLLGKSLTQDFVLYQKLFEKANANIIIFLDGDEVGRLAAHEVYKKLNHGRLYNRIRYINTNDAELDPSEIYKRWGYKGIIHYIRQAKKINEIFLL